MLHSKIGRLALVAVAAIGIGTILLESEAQAFRCRGGMRGCCAPMWCCPPVCCPTYCCYSPCCTMGCGPYMNPTPAMPSQPGMQPGAMPPPVTRAAPRPTSAVAALPPGTARLNVQVPVDAKIFVNGMPTRTVGAERHYLSTPLEDGFVYKYELRAELVVDGQTVTQSKIIRLRNGEQADVNFVAELQVASDAVRNNRASTSTQVSLLQ